MRCIVQRDDEQAINTAIVPSKLEDALAGAGDEQTIDTDNVPVRGVEVRNTFGDLVGWLQPDVTNDHVLLLIFI